AGGGDEARVVGEEPGFLRQLADVDARGAERDGVDGKLDILAASGERDALEVGHGKTPVSKAKPRRGNSRRRRSRWFFGNHAEAPATIRRSIAQPPRRRHRREPGFAKPVTERRVAARNDEG